MKHALRTLLAATTALAVIATPAAAFAAPEKADRTGLQQSLDDVVAGGAVGALAEVRDEHGVWRGASGVSEIDTTTPVPARGAFRAGSITKTFVATVVLQLVDEGELRLDDTVETWLPGVVPGGERITVRHLLDHTSGLYDYKRTLTMPPAPEFLDYRSRTWTSDELIGRALAEPASPESPGSAFAYSNTNYLLLGRVIKEATGRSYADEIENRLVRPLRLSGTEMPGTSTRINGPHPHGYVPIDQGDGVRPVDFTEMNPSLFGASGEMVSTAADLNTFFAALLDGSLVPGELLDEMRTPGTEDRAYGLGLSWRDTSCEIPVFGNDGDAIAYQSSSFATEDGERQVTIALTPGFQGDPDEAVDAFVDRAVCA